MKKALMFLLAVLLLTASAGAVDLYVDTNKIETDTPPTIVNGSTLVPVRAIFEALGATVEWDNDTRTATGTRGETTVVIQIDNMTAYVNGEPKTLAVPAQLINDRTMVPARFISEALGCDVTWYQDTQTAAVADGLKGQQIYVTATGKKYHYSGTCNGGTYYEATLAEAMGRGLTPCEKCVLTSAPTSNNSISVGDIVTLSEIRYFDEHGTVTTKASIGFGSKNVMFFDVNGDVYISDLTMTTFLAEILDEEFILDSHTIISNESVNSYPNLSWSYENGNVIYQYKGITLTYSETATGTDYEVGMQDGCLAINRMGGWILNANDVIAHFGIDKTLTYKDGRIIIE